MLLFIWSYKSCVIWCWRCFTIGGCKTSGEFQVDQIISVLVIIANAINTLICCMRITGRNFLAGPSYIEVRLSHIWNKNVCQFSIKYLFTKYLVEYYIIYIHLFKRFIKFTKHIHTIKFDIWCLLWKHRELKWSNNFLPLVYWRIYYKCNELK